MKRSRQTDIQDFTMVKKSYYSTPNKEILLHQKKEAMSLGAHKIVYVHEDDENTLILRSFYPDAAEDLRRYGVRGVKCIKEMFLGILNLIGMTNKGELQEKCRYFNVVQINALYELVEEMADEIDTMGFINTTRETSNSNIFTYCSISNKDDIGFTKTKIPQFCFLTGTTKERQRTGIFIFMTEVFKLLKYINYKYGFSKHVSFCKNEPSLYDDNFF